MTASRTLAAVAAVAFASPATAQVTGAPAWTSQGYNGAAASVATAFDPNTRDANNNRVVMNGEIQTGGPATVQDQFAALSGGAATNATGAGASATAIGNLLNIQVNGSWNTVIVNANQTNSGAVTAQAGSGSNATTQQKAPSSVQ
jgi:holdfast attachment protein HfaA